jgi:hypothetical protein
MIYVVATSQVKPECRDAFIKGAKECIAPQEGASYESHTINDSICSWSSAGKPARTSTLGGPHMKVWRNRAAEVARRRDHQRRK